ncbi:MAG TPA: radical SAM protein [Pyrinomonadaceae bacterium]|nr:radical SAM protein [Pyrinomonadaceae bacterium]
MEPKYLKLLAANELESRVEKLEALLASCTICPKDCGNDRLNDEIAACYSGRLPIVSSYTAHFGEEPVLSGTNGAGNIFFGNCNLRCVYCQNYQISQTWGARTPSSAKRNTKNEVTHERLAEMMLELQDRGCHNIGFVSPTHFAPQMARAILIAARQGLRLPIVYNTNAYDSVEVIKLLDGIVDIYLPDLKYADSDAGFQYSKVRNYTEHARAAIKEMHRQMGSELVFDGTPTPDGTRTPSSASQPLLKRGLLIRLLVLPNDIAGLEDNLRWIRDELGPQTAVSLMAQYYATNKAATDDRYILLSRRISEREWFEAVSLLEDLGMEEGFMQEYESASYYYRPNFDDRDEPFKDIRDFQ